jgi:hypothetical protein
MVLASHDKTSPPRLSTAPAQVALSSGLIFDRSRRAAQHDFLGTEALEVIALGVLAGKRDDMVTRSREDIDRDAANASGRTG